MSTLLQSVDKFVENISVTDRQEANIESSYNNLKDNLLIEDSNLSVKEVFLNGSYERDTIIRPLDDIDLFAVIDEADYSENGQDPKPQTVLTGFKNYLNSLNDYKDKVKQDRPCVTVFLSDKKFDVLPSLRKAGALWIPNFDLSSWTFTDPKTHTDRLNEIHKRRNCKVKPVVKAVKHWKRENNQNIPSFHVEEVAISVFNIWNFSNLEEGIRFWFEHAEGYLQVDRFNSYDEYSKVKDKIKTVKDKLGEAQKSNDEKQVGEAKKIGKEIFGKEFPALDADEAKGFSSSLKEGALKYGAATGLSATVGSAMAASKGYYGDIYSA
ncbi:hypothetical protein EZS27_021764 [termite gut metagenome]|uniref:Nucleotidyltransferase n=1 Tax=termite gut metagenome TaxID=433724 RepID=A0A5J4R5H5_9ZZZZ